MIPHMIQKYLPTYFYVEPRITNIGNFILDNNNILYILVGLNDNNLTVIVI